MFGKRIRNNSIHELALDKGIWYREAFDLAPSVIAHEYKALFELTEKGQGYEAMFKMKDFLEVFYKLVVFSCAGYVYQHNIAEGMSGNESCRDIKNVIIKDPDLGTYEGIIDEICRNGSPWKIPPVLSGLASQLKELKNSGTANFRNTYIGHGAYMYDPNEKSLDDFKKILKQIRVTLEACEPFWERFSVTLKNKPQIGARAVERPAFSKERVVVIADGKAIDLADFLLFEDKRFYFFNGYRRDTKRVTYLCFSDGSHFGRVSPKIEQLYYSLGGNQPDMNASVEGVYIPEDISILFDDVSNRAFAYYQPEGLVESVRQLMDSVPKGYIQLTGGQGTGKSALCAALDPLLSPYDKIDISDTVVRCYYGSRCSIRGGMDFPNFTSSVFNLINENGYRTIKRDIPESDKSKHISYGYAHNAQDIAAILNEWRRRYQGYGEAKRLLYIIDGMGIMLGAYKNIEKYLPSADMLDNGVYILVTSRTDLSGRLPIAGSIDISELAERESAESYLRYIAKSYCGASLGGISSELTDNMSIAAAAGMVMKHDGTRAAKLSADKCVKRYLELLREIQGVSLFADTETILKALAKSEKGMSIRDISSAVGYGSVNAQVIGLLRDIGCLINKEYGSNGVLYQLDRKYNIF